MTAVVHLVWGPLGTRPLQRFLDSYRRHPAGSEHELVLLFNGTSPAARRQLQPLLDGVPHGSVELAQPVQDLSAYLQAAEQLEHDRLCFLNSYSEILADGWLAKLEAGLEQPRAGLAGCTGSWASVHSAALNMFFLPNPYLRVMPRRSVTRQQMYEIEGQLDVEREGATLAAGGAPSFGRATLGFRARSILRSLRTLHRQLLMFEPFPAYHVRTNAFILDRELLRSLERRPVRSKFDAYLMESGRGSFTRQVQRRGMRTLVVDRDGACYDHDRWPASRTLWQADQQGLLVADNQTRSYQLGGIERRRMLAAFAWGAQGEAVAP